MGKKIAPWLILATAFVVWIACLSRLTPLDYDEALYTRNAEEMMAGGNYLLPTFDGLPFYEKPPTYLWAIILSSHLVDRGAASISPLAARLPSWLASVATVLLLCLAWPRIRRLMVREGDPEGQAFAHPALPGLLYTLTLLPSGGAATVLYDPLLTLAFTPVLLVLTFAYLEAPARHAPGPLKPCAWLVLALSLAVAAAVKGLIGIVLPAFAVFIQLLFLALARNPAGVSAGGRWWGFASDVWVLSLRSVRVFAGPFAAAAVLSAGFYSLIYFSGGRDFVSEFFLVHHLQRGTTAMQGHSGPLFYHPLVVFLGGGMLSSLVLALAALWLESPVRRDHVPGAPAGPSRANMLFPVAWILSFVVFFSLMATKLPNYTWPVWPAIAIAVAQWLVASQRLLSRPTDPAQATRPSSRRRLAARALRLAAQALPLCLGILGVVLPLVFAAVRPWVDPRAGMVLDAIGELPLQMKAACVVAGALFLVQFFLLRRFLAEKGMPALNRFITVAAMCNILALAAIGWGVLPVVEDNMARPIVALSEKASGPLYRDTQLSTVGLRSPLCSSHYSGASPPRQYGSHDITPFAATGSQLIMLPVWREEFCGTFGFEVIARDRFVLLCLGQGRGLRQ